MSDKQLSKEVADKFKLVGVEPGKYNFPNFGEIDLCALDLKGAKALADAGFPYLKKRGKEETTEDAKIKNK